MALNLEGFGDFLKPLDGVPVGIIGKFNPSNAKRGPMDELIKRYAKVLQAIYDNQTAGHLTFEGALANFAHEARPLLADMTPRETGEMRTRR